MDKLGESELTDGHVEHRVKDRLRLGKVLTRLAVASTAKETIGARQRGQGIAPGGPDATDGLLLVVQR